MKNRIKKILKESINEKIIGFLIKKGLNFFDYHGVLAYLNELGFEKNESEKIFREYSGIIGDPRITIYDDDDVTYELDLVDGFIEISGTIEIYDDDGYENIGYESISFEPSYFTNKKSEIYYDYNWEMIENQIDDTYIEIQYQKHRKK